MRYHVSGPSSASRSHHQGLRLLQCLQQWEGHVWWWLEPGCGIGSELSFVRKQDIWFLYVCAYYFSLTRPHEYKELSFFFFWVFLSPKYRAEHTWVVWSYCDPSVDSRGLGFDLCQLSVPGLTLQGALQQQTDHGCGHRSWTVCVASYLAVFRKVTWSLGLAFSSSASVCMLSCVWHVATPWTVIHQAPLFTGFPRQDTKVGFCFLSQRVFPTQRLTLVSLVSPSLAGGFFTNAPPGKPSSFEYGIRKVLASYGFIKIKYINICKEPRTMLEKYHLLRPAFIWTSPSAKSCSLERNLGC